MKEAYLHFIWKFKRIPFHQLKTTDNKTIQILSPGFHNATESGPDFFNARIFFDNLEWAGQIEMHVKSSDWYLHKHHLDEAYQNVILHVVYEHDQEVICNGNTLPTIELKSIIDQTHFDKWKEIDLNPHPIACHQSLMRVDEIYLKTMLTRTFYERFHRKVEKCNFYQHVNNEDSLLYHLFAKSFGSKVNEVPFELLSNQLTLAQLRAHSFTEQQQLIYHKSGLFSTTRNYKSTSLPASIWKKKGLRPHAFPEKRIAQFAHLVTHLDFRELTNMISPQQAKQLIDEWTLKVNQEIKFPVGSDFINQLNINALFVFFWHRAIQHNNDLLMEGVVKAMEAMPAEKNHITKQWNQLGIRINNAFESQALLELYNNYCTPKKCLKCQLGTKILSY